VINLWYNKGFFNTEKEHTGSIDERARLIVANTLVRFCVSNTGFALVPTVFLNI